MARKSKSGWYPELYFMIINNEEDIKFTWLQKDGYYRIPEIATHVRVGVGKIKKPRIAFGVLLQNPRFVKSNKYGGICSRLGFWFEIPNGKKSVSFPNFTIIQHSKNRIFRSYGIPVWH